MQTQASWCHCFDLGKDFVEVSGSEVVPQGGADAASPWSFLCASDFTAGRGCAAASDFRRWGCIGSRKWVLCWTIVLLVSDHIIVHEELGQIILLVLTFKGTFTNTWHQGNHTVFWRISHHYWTMSNFSFLATGKIHLTNVYKLFIEEIQIPKTHLWSGQPI